MVDGRGGASIIGDCNRKFFDLETKCFINGPAQAAGKRRCPRTETPARVDELELRPANLAGALCWVLGGALCGLAGMRVNASY